jgi:hypothetical protein
MGKADLFVKDGDKSTRNKREIQSLQLLEMAGRGAGWCTGFVFTHKFKILLIGSTTTY